MDTIRERMIFAFAVLLLGGCATEQGAREDTLKTVQEVRTAPQEAPVRSVTNFTPALRCMDNTFLMYGTRDIVVITEDIEDRTKKVSAGTKDMLITSVSEMTKRSRAVKLIAYGNDSGNLISYMQSAEQKNIYQVLPQFGIRGSISQFDENIAKKTEGFGLAVEPFFGAGKAATSAASILGLDLTMMSTSDLSIVPGVTSNNSVSILRSGSGLEAEAGYKKFGINYQMNLSRSDGMAQALRNLVQLATVEIFGKLTKTPYWVCLGGSIQDEAVATEVSDWYQSLFSESGALVGYWQNQMRIRSVYVGEVNGVPDDALRDAVMAYRQALGMEKNAKLDLDFFKTYLSANHYEVAPKAQALLVTLQNSVAKNISQAQNDFRPIRLSINSGNNGGKFRRGEDITLDVRPDRDAFVYCFMQDENKKIMRFFPNRFVRDPFVSTKGMKMPRKDEFRIQANTIGAREEVACYAANRDVFSDLPKKITSGDFEPLGVANMEEIENEFRRATGSAFGVGRLPVIVNK